MSRNTSIRSLRPGESVPEGTPRRYVGSDGYVKLRWRIGPYEAVEVREHRVVAGRVTEAPQVHHVNHDRADNRPENLVELTAAEHRAEHRRPDYDRIAAMYRSGMSTPKIAAEMGTDSAAALRALRSAGVPMRTLAESLTREVDEDRIRLLHSQGVRARTIAKQLGVSATLVESRFKKLGLAPFRTGRP